MPTPLQNYFIIEVRFLQPKNSRYHARKARRWSSMTIQSCASCIWRSVNCWSPRSLRRIFSAHVLPRARQSARKSLLCSASDPPHAAAGIRRAVLFHFPANSPASSSSGMLIISPKRNIPSCTAWWTAVSYRAGTHHYSIFYAGVYFFRSCLCNSGAQCSLYFFRTIFSLFLRYFADILNKAFLRSFLWRSPCQKRLLHRKKNTAI